jgi:hypothetical protein
MKPFALNAICHITRNHAVRIDNAYHDAGFFPMVAPPTVPVTAPAAAGVKQVRIMATASVHRCESPVPWCMQPTR